MPRLAVTIAILCSILAHGDMPDDEADCASLIQLNVEHSRKRDSSPSKLVDGVISRLEDDARKVVAKFERLGYSDAGLMSRMKDQIRKMTLSQVETASWSDGDTTRPECVAIKATAAGNRYGAHGELFAGHAAADDLTAAGWTFVRGFNVSEGEDWDYSGWWEKDGACTITFQGSDDDADFANNWNPTPKDIWGLHGVHEGLTNELQQLINQMDFSAINTKCTESLTVVGHSLGGGLAQLFSAAINHPDDKLGANLNVDKLYTFGAMPVAEESLENGGVVGGCFPGSLYYTAKIDDSGSTAVDIVGATVVGGGGVGMDPVKAEKVLLFDAPSGGPQTFPCGEKLPLKDYTNPGFSLHLIQMYEFRMGCITEVEYMTFMQGLMSMSH